MNTSHDMYIASWLKEINQDFLKFIDKISKRGAKISEISMEHWQIYDSLQGKNLPVGSLISQYSDSLQQTQAFKALENSYDREFGFAMSKMSLVAIQDLINSFAEHLEVSIVDLSSMSFADQVIIYKDLRSQLTSKFQTAYSDFFELQKNLKYCLDIIPNTLDDSVPIGNSEKDNVCLESWGSNEWCLDFEPLAHFEVAKRTMDFESGVKTSGSRFVFLHNNLAKLARALENFMLDFVGQYSYIETACPQLVKDAAMYGVGQLPKMAQDSFVVDGKYRLIPTAEVPLTNLVSDQLLSYEQLPLRFCSATECFRSEAGSAGRDIEGMIRMHQFRKVEIVSVVAQENSKEEHERMMQIVADMLRALELPHRIMLLASGDLGFASEKTYDFEVWLPSQKRYREIASCSKFGHFQARRMNVRYLDKDNVKKYVHTLNSSALPIGRTLIAILENYQQKQSGLVAVPHVLWKYLSTEDAYLTV